MPGTQRPTQSFVPLGPLLIGGIGASLVYAAANVVGALRWPAYRWMDQAVSELSAVGAPSRPVMLALLLAHTLLALVFAVGVLASAGGNHALRATGWCLVAVGVVDLVALLFPMHQRGVGRTWSDTGHIVMTGVNVLAIMLAIGFSAAALGRGFRYYSLLTLAAMTVFGVLASSQAAHIAANEPTPWHGLHERITIGGYLLWMAMLAIVLAVNTRPGAVRRVCGRRAAPS